MSIVEKAKLDIESAHISDIIESRRIAATDKASEENMRRALDHIMKNPPRLQPKPPKELTLKSLQQCPQCGHQPQQEMQDPSSQRSAGPIPEQPSGPPQMGAGQPNPVGGLHEYVDSLPPEALQQLLEIIKKKTQTIRNPVDQPRFQPQGY